MIQARLLALLRNKTVLYSVIIAVVTAGTFFTVVGFNFVSWDDDLHVYGNPYLAPVNLQNLAHFWRHPYHGLYIPVAYMVFAAIAVLARTSRQTAALAEFATPLNPHLFHAAGLILHIVNAVLVFFLARRFVKSDMPAAFGALLFAVHPLQVESVAWISELRGLLSAMFCLMAMLVFEKSSESDAKPFGPMAVLSVFLFALSLLSKPSTAVVPVVLLLWQTTFGNRPLRESLVRLCPWFALALGDSYITHSVQPMDLAAPLPLLQRVIVSGDTLGFYLQKLFWPANLCTEYGRTPLLVFADHLEIPTIACVIVTAVLCLVFVKRKPWLVPCVLTFVLFILPVSGIVPFGYQFFSTVADRYAYLAMLGPAFAVSFALTEISGFMACRAVCSTCAVGLCLMSFVSAKQAATWRNTQTLFAHAAAINPGDWLPHNQLGMSYLRQQNFPAAERQFRMVVTLGPVDSRFWVSLGQSVEQQKRYPEAAYYFSQALTISPGFSNALYFRAQCEAMTNQPALAVADYTAAIPGLPPTTYADNELAMEFGAMGRYSDAATEFAKTVHLHPDYLPAYYFLAMTDTKLGNHKAAQQAAETALAINPNYTPVMPYVSVASAHP